LRMEACQPSLAMSMKVSSHTIFEQMLKLFGIV
jgi:hypothetical protein